MLKSSRKSQMTAWRHLQPNLSAERIPSRERFPTNKVKTTKYTTLNFFPKALLQQLTVVMNCFYIVNGLLQFIPSISTNSPWTTLIPLSFVILLGVAKEYYADYKRAANDKVSNRLPTTRLFLGEMGSLFEHETTAATLEVGDVIRIKNNEMVPADCLLLASHPRKGFEKADPSKVTECFVSTKSLDGESNLKPKAPLVASDSLFRSGGLSSELISTLQVSMGPPSADLYRVHGFLEIEQRSQEVDLKQFLHKGAILKNSHFVDAIVMYTGLQSKIVLNEGKYQFKKSRLDQAVNWISIFNMFMIFGLSGIMSIFSLLFINENRVDGDSGAGEVSGAFYIFYKSPSNMASKSFFSYYLLLNQFLPMPLFIAMEIIKILYTLLMEWDASLVNPETGSKFSAKTMQVHEEMGQIQYLFCDKTGTLTKNQLVFKDLSIRKMRATGGSSTGQIKSSSKGEGESDGEGAAAEEAAMEAQERANFLRCVLLCHDVVRINGVLSGASQDELVLMEELEKDYGARLVSKEADELVISLNPGSEERYKVLKVNEFSSERKMMSVTVRSEDGTVLNFCKGADMVIKSRLKAIEPEDNELIELLDSFALKGLRTLMFAFKEVAPSEVVPPSEQSDLAPTAIFDRMETNYHLLGVTGVEDLLQDNVRACIQDFISADIKVWMLTGDKGATARQIGKACGILKPSMALFQIHEDTSILYQLNEIQADLKELDEVAKRNLKVSFATSNRISLPAQKKKDVNRTAGDTTGAFSDSGDDSQFEQILADDEHGPKLRESRMFKFSTFKNPSEIAKEHGEITSGLLVSGATLPQIFATEQTLQAFAEVLRRMQSIVVYRSSPAQKAEIVKLIRKNKAFGHPVTAAIGDGANDVNMIQSAHIGFGLQGKEGNQAASFSDYSLTKFSELSRLVFWHGRTFAWKMSNFLMWFMFKSMVFSISILFFNTTSGYSGSTFIEDFYYAFFGIYITTFAAGLGCLFDQDISFTKGEGGEEAIRELAIPEYYKFKIDSHLHKKLKRFVAWSLYSWVGGAIVFYVPFMSMTGAVNSRGLTDGLWSAGLMSLTALVVLHHVQVAMSQRNITWMLAFIDVASYLLFMPLTTSMTNSAAKEGSYHTVYSDIMGGTPLFYLSVLVAVAAVVSPLYFLKCWEMTVASPGYYAGKK